METQAVDMKNCNTRGINNQKQLYHLTKGGNKIVVNL